MGWVENKLKYTNQYNKEHRERISLSVRKGIKGKWLEAAEKQGLSLNAFVIQCVEDKIGCDFETEDNMEILQGYYLVTEKNGDQFEEELDATSDAVAVTLAHRIIDKLSDYDKENSKFTLVYASAVEDVIDWDSARELPL